MLDRDLSDVYVEPFFVEPLGLLFYTELRFSTLAGKHGVGLRMSQSRESDVYDTISLAQLKKELTTPAELAFLKTILESKGLTRSAFQTAVKNTVQHFFDFHPQDCFAGGVCPNYM